MSNCCSINKEPEQHSKKFACPINGKQYHEVPYITVLHHVRDSWRQAPKEQAYYFCEDPECEVVYFGSDNSTIRKDQLRTNVGIKSLSDNALICYCFGIPVLEARNNKQTKAFVTKQTKKSRCSCKTFNPSGRCCLKDFPKNY